MSNGRSKINSGHCGRFGPPVLSRREMLERAGMGIGSLALASLLQTDSVASENSANPEGKVPQGDFGKAKSVIYLFMAGGPSQVDTYDPKPLLTELDGKDTPESIRALFPITAMQGNGTRTLMGTPFTFDRYGKSGLPASEIVKETAQHIDDLCIIRSMKHDTVIHTPGEYIMTTGTIVGDRPSLGSWILYGLGSENQNLPGFVVLGDAPPRPSYGPGFLAARNQGTVIPDALAGIPNLGLPSGLSAPERRAQLDLLRGLNRRHLERQSDADTELEARIGSYELAFRMQMSAPEAFDIRNEPEETRRLYGLDKPVTRGVGANCLLARRLVERGVRFIEVRVGGWDSHGDLKGGHGAASGRSDRPIAGLLSDLKRRGLLESTLVFWGGEFGRTPGVEGKNGGRDHSPGGFTVWLAGGGIKGGQQIGTTDDVGYTAVETPYHPNDLHATILHSLGVDQHQLYFEHNGRREIATFNGGKIIKNAFA